MMKTFVQIWNDTAPSPDILTNNVKVDLMHQCLYFWTQICPFVQILIIQTTWV